MSKKASIWSLELLLVVGIPALTVVAAAPALDAPIVEESARGLNLGRVLVQRTIDDARRRGCAEMGLYLVPRTEGNRGFYEKLGFKRVSFFPILDMIL